MVGIRQWVKTQSCCAGSLSTGAPLHPSIQPVLPCGVRDCRESPIHPQHGILPASRLWSMVSHEKSTAFKTTDGYSQQLCGVLDSLTLTEDCY